MAKTYFFICIFKQKILTIHDRGFVEDGVSKGKDKIYRVKVGKFSERKEAARINDKLIREGYPTKICP